MIDGPIDTATVWQMLSGDLRRYFQRRVSTAEQVDDLLQETFVRIHTQRAALHTPDALRPWVYRIARSVLVDAVRRDRPSTPLHAVILPDDPDFAEDDPDALVASWLPAMIAMLPEPYREPLRMVELEGRSQKAVAETLALSHSGTRSRIQRGRKMLRDVLLACCEIQREGGQVVDYRPRTAGGCTCEDQ